MSENKKFNLAEVSDERGDDLVTSSLFTRLLKKAARFLGTPGRIFRLIADAYSKSDNINGISSISAKLKTQIFGLFDLVKDYAKGDYKEMETKDVLMIVAGMLYLVSPLDFVPDFIPMFGLLDDISILSFIIAKLSEEIDAYLLWKNHQIKKPKKETTEPKVIDITDT